MMGQDITPEYGRTELLVLEGMYPKEADRIYPSGKAGKLPGSSGHELCVSNEYIIFWLTISLHAVRSLTPSKYG
jgi:hypothetical protein